MRGWHLLRLGRGRVGIWNSRRTVYRQADVALRRKVVRERLANPSVDEDDPEFDDLQQIEAAVIPKSAYDDAGLVPVVQKLVREVYSGSVFEKEPHASGASSPSTDDEAPRGGAEAKDDVDRGTSPVHIEIPTDQWLLGPKLDNRFLTESLNLGKPHEDDEKALQQRFKDLQRNEKPSKNDYIEMMWQSSFRDSMEYLAMMTNKGMALDELTANVVAWRPGSEKHPEKWDMFKNMAEKAGVGRRALCNVELSRAARSGDLETAAACAARLQTESIKPDDLTWLWMIHAYYRAGKMDECVAFFRRLIGVPGMQQNLAVFDAFVRATTLSGHQEHAARAVMDFFKFSKKSKRGRRCDPLLESLFRGKDSNLVFNTYNSLKSEGFKSTAGGVERLITIFGLSRQMERVDKVYLQAGATIQDSIIARDALLFAWHVNEHHDFVDQEFENIQKERQTSLHTTAIMLNNYGRRAKWDTFEDLWIEKFGKKKRAAWLEHYKILILYYGRREDIIKLTWKDLKMRPNMFVDEDVFNLLVDVAQKDKMKPFLKKIVAKWLELHKRRRKPSATREKVNRALYEEKKWDYQLKWYWQTEGVQDLKKPIPRLSWEHGMPPLRELVVCDARCADRRAPKQKKK